MAIQNSIIPAEKSSEFSSWKVPEVNDGQVVNSEKIQKRGPRGELVNVDKNEVIYSSITAAQLEEISNQAYEDVKKQAYKEGHKKGYGAGYDAGQTAGLKAGEKIIAEQSLALNTLIEQIYDYLGGQDDEVEQALVNLSVCISQSVIRRELKMDSSQIMQIVSEAVATLPLNSNNIRIFLSEQDFNLLKLNNDIPDHWSLKIESQLSPGGCRVITDHSVVDYTLEEQFQQTVNAIVEKRFSQLAEHAQSPENSDVNKDAMDKTDSS